MTVFETFVELEPEPALDDEVFVPYAVVVPISKESVVVRLFGSTLPFSLTLVVPIELAADVTAVGGSAVTKVLSAPAVVPAELVATTRKWYVLPGVRLPTAIETVFDVVPDPADVAAVFVPYDVDVPYSMVQSVDWPLGLTVPPSVAPVGPTPEAADVTTTGGDAVVNRPSAPFVVADVFFATSR